MTWLLAGCALFGAGIAAWKLVDLSMKAGRDGRLLSAVAGLLDRQQVAEALAAARDFDAPGARVVVAGLSQRDGGAHRVGRAAADAWRVEAAALQRGLPALGILARSALLVGGLATALGWFSALQQTRTEGIAPSALSAAIEAATFNAVLGLLIALPLDVVRTYLGTRVDRIGLEIHDAARGMIDTLSAMDRSVPPSR